MALFLRGARACRVQDQILIQGVSRIPTGSKLYGPVFAVGIFDPAKIGSFIIEALNESRENIPPNDDGPLNPKAPILKMAKVRSWTAFNRISKSVGITEKGEHITFTPTKPVSRLAFTFLEDKTLISDLTPENMGKTLLQAFEICE